MYQIGTRTSNVTHHVMTNAFLFSISTVPSFYSEVVTIWKWTLEIMTGCSEESALQKNSPDLHQVKSTQPHTGRRQQMAQEEAKTRQWPVVFFCQEMEKKTKTSNSFTQNTLKRWRHAALVSQWRAIHWGNRPVTKTVTKPSTQCSQLHTSIFSLACVCVFILFF